jgi:hypothetical protein
MIRSDIDHPLELDALGLEEEEEGPSYLSELNKAPDFVDEAPVEEVIISLSRSIGCLYVYIDSRKGGSQGIWMNSSTKLSPPCHLHPSLSLPPALVGAVVPLLRRFCTHLCEGKH